MLLTALFALNIASIELSNRSLSIEQTIGMFLLVAIGLCIDVSKYLFWLYRKEHRLFLSLSIILLTFSWLASVAFFTSKENETIRANQIGSSSYIANKTAIESLELQIVEKRQLLKKRLSSNYHSQWDQGDILLEEIASLNQQLKEQIIIADTIGLEDARLQLSTSALFSSLSSMLSLSFTTVSSAAYALLALIIEVCSLGVMSLVQIVSLNKSNSKQQIKRDVPFVLNRRNRRKNAKRNEKIKRDILEGKTKPLISKIIKDYSISHKEAKAIMESLEAEGKINISRRRYHLIDE